MRPLLSKLIAPAVIALTAALCLGVAVLAVGQIEARTERAVEQALAQSGTAWAEAEPNGMLVHLRGTAPDEAARFHALSTAGKVIDPANLVDEIEVAASAPVAAPDFLVELLRNDAGISVIGLIPRSTDRARLSRGLEKIAGGTPVTDMLQSADHLAPEGWQDALDFGIEALEDLDRAKISITPDEVSVTAISDNATDKARIERKLRRAAPDGLRLALDISAPRPIIAPFTLRFLLDDTGARFDACAADTEAAADRILAAARDVGMAGKGACTVALGVPDPGWAAAVDRAIGALADLGGGKLTFSDADVTLVARPGTDARLFDRVAGELEADLPDIYTLHAVLPEPEKVDGSGAETGPKEFVATLSPEGLLQLRGRVPDALVRGAVESYAHARFGPASVHSAMRVDPALPEGWPLRVLTGLQALSQLRNGALIVQAGFLRIEGLTMDEDARARVTRLLADKLGEAQNYAIDITYQEPAASEEPDHPTPETCVAQINDILAEQKITFAPGSSEIEGAAVRVIDKIATVLRFCPDARMEIGGHTDSQGREEMNQALSQSRADAVLNALMARRVLTGNLTAKGYGESEPIATNDTEDGREANRRIAFRLIADDGTPVDPAAEAQEAQEDEAAPPEDAAQPAEEDSTDGQD